MRYRLRRAMRQLKGISRPPAVVVLASCVGCTLVVGNETRTVVDASTGEDAATSMDAATETSSDPPDVVAPIEAAADSPVDTCNLQACNVAESACKKSCDTTAGVCNSNCGKSKDGKDCHDLCAQQQQQCHTDCVTTCDACVSGCGAPCAP